MADTQELTVGVITRNGLPFLNDCLAALPEIERTVGSVSFVLVDSASTDGSGSALKAFAKGRTNVEVFRINGEVNAAVARNVIIDNAKPGFLLLVDGDIVPESDFVKSGMQAIDQGRAEAVLGNLMEKWYDTNYELEHGPIIRSSVKKEKYDVACGGMMLIGPAAAARGTRQDERLRKTQDLDYAFRAIAPRQLLWLPITMGTHLTHHYFSDARIGDFYRSAYPIPAGRMIRKNIRFPGLIVKMMELYKGSVLGAFYQVVAILALVAGNMFVLTCLGGLVLLDFLRAVKRKSIYKFFAVRFATPWMILYGLFSPWPPTLTYRVTRIE
jgi:glycosyltransferase involved in cell wall biosynthesis